MRMTYEEKFERLLELANAHSRELDGAYLDVLDGRKSSRLRYNPEALIENIQNKLQKLSQKLDDIREFSYLAEDLAGE